MRGAGGREWGWGYLHGTVTVGRSFVDHAPDRVPFPTHKGARAASVVETGWPHPTTTRCPRRGEMPLRRVARCVGSFLLSQLPHHGGVILSSSCDPLCQIQDLNPRIGYSKYSEFVFQLEDLADKSIRANELDEV